MSVNVAYPTVVDGREAIVRAVVRDHHYTPGKKSIFAYGCDTRTVPLRIASRRRGHEPYSYAVRRLSVGLLGDRVSSRQITH